MSVKIYDGLKAVDSEPFEVNRKIRKVLEDDFFWKFEILENRAKEMLESNPDATWDDAFYVTTKRGAEKISEARDLTHGIHGLVGHLHRKSVRTFSAADIGYEVVLLHNSAGGNPLVMVFGENSSKLTELLVEEGVVTRYGYWDNTDPEDGVSEEEWEERERAWKIVMDKSPSEVGLTISYPSYMQVALRKHLKKN